MTEFTYIGSELELFAGVANWKNYWSRSIHPYIQGDVLEVGAGIGSNTAFMDSEGEGRWVCLEPDSRLVVQLSKNLAQNNRRNHEIVTGTLQTLDAAEKFDTIIYIDVLEHIEDDRGELGNAASRLKPGGRAIVLSPAHQRLYTPFDKAVGHYRRYDRLMLRKISPAGLRLERLIYLDSLGLALSTANALLLKQSMPTKSQLAFWDKCVIPISRVLDKCTLHSIGKTIVGIWRKE